MVAMQKELEEKNKLMLHMEIWLAGPATISGLILCFIAATIDMPEWTRIALIVFAIGMIFAMAFVAVGIEQKAGFYECQNCKNRYVPTYWQVNLAPHIGRTRYMKCPACAKKSWQKKVLVK